MTQRERYLSDDRFNPWLAIEKRSHENSGYHVEEQCSYDAGENEVPSRGGTLLEEECSPNADCSVGQRGYDGPRTSLADDDVKQSDAQGSIKTANPRTVCFWSCQLRRHQRRDIPQAQEWREEAEDERTNKPGCIFRQAGQRMNDIIFHNMCGIIYKPTQRTLWGFMRNGRMAWRGQTGFVPGCTRSDFDSFDRRNQYRCATVRDSHPTSSYTLYVQKSYTFIEHNSTRDPFALWFA